LLAATNRPERVEPTLLRSGRFDYILRFAKPDAAERVAIMRLCCRRVPLASDVEIEELGGRMEGLTGADVESLCKKATLLAIAEFQNGTRGAPFVVCRNDFVSVLESRGSDD
jgi:transitional endoplasmic reticulum ATPase